MSSPASALVVIDVQESFRYRPYWNPDDVARFLGNLQRLVDGAVTRGVPVLQVFHVEDSGPFSLASGHVVTMAGLTLAPAAVFHKQRHSALVGSGLGVWLTSHGVRRLIVSGIRTEQCCETTTRHASDLGFDVDFVTEATLSFAMTDRHGQTWAPAEIRARTELVLDGRFARVTDVAGALGDASVRLGA